MQGDAGLTKEEIDELNTWMEEEETRMAEAHA